MGLFGTQTKNEKSAPVMMEEPPQETFQEPPRLPKPRVGTVIAKRALEKGIEEVVFDRGGFIYHGKVQALADAAREAGLKF